MLFQLSYRDQGCHGRIFSKSALSFAFEVFVEVSFWTTCLGAEFIEKVANLLLLWWGREDKSLEMWLGNSKCENFNEIMFR